MMDRVRKLAGALRKTPLHPQWFAFLQLDRDLAHTCDRLSGIVLDVGCAECTPRNFLPPAATYVGLDYYSTATGWYRTQPDVYGDAQSLPIADNSVDHGLLLDVMEHLPDPDRALAELHRVIRQGGTLTLQVPFLYPLHDEPLDFHRWTSHGLRQAADRHGYEVSEEIVIGHPLETAALNTNIALSRTVINWMQGRNPLLLLFPILPLAVLANNVIAWLLARLSKHDGLMPHSYRVVWIKR
jgi:SAM-dependent methyltransferase